jgi:hypothetical protein
MALERAITSRFLKARSVLMRSFDKQDRRDIVLLHQQQLQLLNIPTIHLVSSIFESGKASRMNHGSGIAVGVLVRHRPHLLCRWDDQNESDGLKKGDVGAAGNSCTDPNNNNHNNCRPSKISPCGIVA